ncbi:MAG: hypothetical protein ACREOF_19000, partial [Gemmatimonadales bacterium]
RDTARATPMPPAPAPVPAAPANRADVVPPVVCAGAAPGEAAPDVLGVVFETDAPIEAREAAVAAVSGKRLAGAAADAVQFLQVPAGGSEFTLRTFADKLIRLRGVSEVGPVTCPAQPARPDSTSS